MAGGLGVAGGGRGVERPPRARERERAVNIKVGRSCVSSKILLRAKVNRGASLDVGGSKVAMCV